MDVTVVRTCVHMLISIVYVCTCTYTHIMIGLCIVSHVEGGEYITRIEFCVRYDKFINTRCWL